MSKTQYQEKPVILILLNYYSPGYKAGGPIRSISNIVSWLGDEFNFKIFTTDRDLFDKNPYKEVEINKWNNVNNADVYYAGMGDMEIRSLYKILNTEEYGIVYINSFFNFLFSVVPLFLLSVVLNFNPKKILLAPRGELSKGALAQKTIKKKLFLWVTQFLGIHRKIQWHATNEKEKKEIIERVGVDRKNIFIASNLPQKINDSISGEVQKEVQHLKMVYLSRITPKKNLDYTLRLLREVRDINVVYDIYGNISDKKYWGKCKSLIEKLPHNINVQYKGAINHENVISTLGNYHLFFLPTKGENYGHAIYEAMIAGTPVLISDQTPWLQLEEKGIGWSLSLDDKNKFKQAIRTVGEMEEGELNKLKDKVQTKIKELDINKTVEATKTMFKSVV